MSGLSGGNVMETVRGPIGSCALIFLTILLSAVPVSANTGVSEIVHLIRTVCW